MVVLIFFFIMGFFGSVYSLGDTFGLLLDGRWLLLFSLIYSSLYLMRKRARIVLPLFGLLCTFFAVYNLESLKTGAVVFVRMVNDAVLQYTGVSEGFQGLTEETAQSAEIFLAFVFFFWGALLFYGIFVRGARAISILNLVLGAGTALAVGKVPGLTQSCLMAFCCLGAFASAGVGERKVRAKAVLLTGILGLVCLIFGKLAVMPVLSPVFENREVTKSKIQDSSFLQELLVRLPDFTSGFLAKGGMSKGDLRGTDAFLYSGKTALEVRTKQKPEETVYLRGFIGAEYESKRWVPPEAFAEEEVEEKAYQFAEKLVKSMWYTGADHMSVTRLSADAEFEYRPYFSEQSGEAEKEQYQYDYYPVTQIKKLTQWVSYFNDQELIDQELLQSYIKYPEEQLIRLKKFTEENPVENPVVNQESVIAVIRKALSDQCTYNLQTGRFPPREDFADYFFFERKEGYCVHFATTAVLMFRMYGVPARYAEGYIAPAKDFKKDGDSYLAKVSDERAHAWVEIYSFPKGWIPVEVTPGFIQTSTAQQESEGFRQSEQEKKDDLPQTQKQTEETETGKRQEGKATLSLRALLVAAAIAAVLAAAVFLLFLRRTWIRRKRRRGGAKELFPDLYRILLLGGWKETVDCESPLFAKKLSETFSWLDEREMAEVMDIVMRANFSGQPVTGEEEERVRNLYVRVFDEVCAGLTRLKRIRLFYLFRL